MASHRHATSPDPVTYTSAGKISGPTFTCPRCGRVYPYPSDHGAPIRCECGWWYTNLGHGKLVEEFRSRIGGARAEGADAAAAPGAPARHRDGH
jgi:hypothetical protein